MPEAIEWPQVEDATTVTYSHGAALTRSDAQQRTSSEDSLVRFIAEMMARIGAVESVHCRDREDVFYIWLVVAANDDDTLDRILATEQLIIERFPECEFDFYIVYRNDESYEDLIGHDVRLVWTRD